jgi:type I restriction enzyme S subunit
VKCTAYDEYKPSGIEWLGNVPAHWTIARSDGIVSSERRQVQPEVFLSEDVFHYSIPLVQELGTGAIEDGESIKSAKQPVFRKSLLVSKLNPRKATIVVAEPQPDLRTFCSTEFVTLFADKCDLGFLTYVTFSEAFRQRLDAAVQSVTRSHQRANPRDIYSFWNAWPPLDEQQSIARFLDAKTAQIDALVAQKRQLIDKLKEKRSALIARTVTRGLPPAAAKAAGLEPKPAMENAEEGWIGEMPVHWKTKKGSHLGRLIGSVAPAEEDITEDEDGVPYAKVDDLNSLDSSLRLTSTKVRLQCAPPRWNTIVLFPKRGAAIFTNKVALAQGVTFDSNLMGWEIHKSSDPKFVAYCLIARRLDDLADVSTVPQINNKHIYPAKFPHPPKPEQEAIVSFLDRATTRIDQLVGNVESAIAHLTEYRQALITSAVTGKIDVRGLA